MVKREIVEREIAGRYRIDFVVDDRGRVVAMWREQLGLTCCEVVPGTLPA